jgi:dipeptidyl aminopeptidase/acylaminoacyl peptidase
MRKLRFCVSLLALIFLPTLLFAQQQPQPPQKPPLTLDEFFNSVAFDSLQISPSGDGVVITTERADWKSSRFRTDLWLYRVEGSGGHLLPLTQSGHDSAPQWSPDGRWIAFLSDRAPAAAPESEPETEESAEAPAPEKNAEQVYVISATGGEAFPVTFGEEAVHSFAWSADSASIYNATRQPLTKEQEAAQKKEWQDVVRFREQERGDLIRRVDLAAIRAWNAAGSVGKQPEPETIASTEWYAEQMASSPDGRWLAFRSDSRSRREESLAAYGIYLIGLAPENRTAAPVNLLGPTQAIFDRFLWSRDSRKIFFSFLNGAVEGPYKDAQSRVYSVDIVQALARRREAPKSTGPFVRWGAKFFGAITGYAVLPDDALFAAGRLGTEVQPYVQSEPSAAFAKQSGWSGTYETLSAAAHSPRIAFVHSSLDRPSEVYLAPSAEKIDQARPITSFNKLFTERALPRGKPFRWTADDGMPVEGMLIYPPGKFGQMHLPMFTLIHGGPEDADGNHFEADWYQWAALAATQGWLVFEPNYRGSIGYGDTFALGIIPHIVSRPGKDILEGVDALVKAGIADPNDLTVGGYSYGGYMTNWLITQTTRFKAAVTGAGAVEHVVNWGNDDTTWDDAYFLGGLPWATEARYNAEAAIWQIAKVRTPTHMVAGADDIRVYVGEDYLLERALHTLGIPCTLLVFPGEGHELAKNPWHGKIKVREELKWLQKYGRP